MTRIPFGVDDVVAMTEDIVVHDHGGGYVHLEPDTHARIVQGPFETSFPTDEDFVSAPGLGFLVEMLVPAETESQHEPATPWRHEALEVPVDKLRLIHSESFD
jgi:hypothetical protein